MTFKTTKNVKKMHLRDDDVRKICKLTIKSM